MHYTLISGSSYKLFVRFGSPEVDIPGSPFEVIVTPGVIDPSHSTCGGVGLSQVVETYTASFLLQLKDKYSNSIVADLMNLRVLQSLFRLQIGNFNLHSKKFRK